MYLNKIEINNIKSIAHAIMTFEEGEQAGWHVLIGGNGMGKSAFIKAVALTLVGHLESAALNQNWNDWLATGIEKGYVLLESTRDNKYDNYSGQNRETLEFYMWQMNRITEQEDRERKQLLEKYKYNVENLSR
jgi:predicted ATP-dependent endonuclease of OLD family